MSAAPSIELRAETFVNIGQREFCIEVSPVKDDRIWVSVKEYQEELKWWKCVCANFADAPCTELDAIRYAFRSSRRRMNNFVQSWDFYRRQASEDPKRKSYFGKMRNECLREALRSAAEWKLMKQIWKELTRL